MLLSAVICRLVWKFIKQLANKILLENVVVALGTNTVENYEALLNQIVAKLPKGHRLILVTPYDGRTAHNGASIAVKTRQYELELAKKYDYVFVADWYKTAIQHPKFGMVQIMYTLVQSPRPSPKVGNYMLKQSNKRLMRQRKKEV